MTQVMAKVKGVTHVEDPLGEDMGSDEDAEGEEDDEPVAKVDFGAIDNDEEDGEEDAEGEVDSQVNSAVDSEGDASDASSDTEPEVEWEGESDEAEEVEADIADRNNCM